MEFGVSHVSLALCLVNIVGNVRTCLQPCSFDKYCNCGRVVHCGFERIESKGPRFDLTNNNEGESQGARIVVRSLP